MALLLQCLRAVRTRSGDLDLLPSQERSVTCTQPESQPRRSKELRVASSSSHYGTSRSFPTGSPRQVAEECH
jgi:hypothetical protein